MLLCKSRKGCLVKVKEYTLTALIKPEDSSRGVYAVKSCLLLIIKDKLRGEMELKEARGH